MAEQFIKLLLIGDSGVGKSCILTRYCQDRFSTAFYNTIGVDFKTKQIVLDNIKCKMQIWDTAGQQRFRTITSNYYRGANGILLVFDVTSKQSFKDVSYWLEEVQRHGNGTIVVILVGNKCDLVSKREVSEEEGNAFAKGKGIDYIQVSALNSANVSLVFEAVGRNILRKELSVGKKQGKNGANGGKADEKQQQQIQSKGQLQRLRDSSNKIMNQKCC